MHIDRKLFSHTHPWIIPHNDCRMQIALGVTHSDLEQESASDLRHCLDLLPTAPASITYALQTFSQAAFQNTAYLAQCFVKGRKWSVPVCGLSGPGASQQAALP